MTENDQDGTFLKQEGARFLERDFNQCFQQMRHYDDQLWQICKFAFTGYTTVLGVAVGLHQYSMEKQVDLYPAAIAVLSVATALGLLFLALTTRNRVYFVVTTRYINEQRRHFLAQRPLGFPNATKMYTNPEQPPYFNWRSSQAWFLYIIALLNAVLVGALTFIILKSAPTVQWRVAVAFLIGTFLFQLIVCVAYLTSREKKGAGKAVFGRE